ncbi:LTA synthase family protein [Limosilactobacillus mucosae]|uniref:LTA synthase family protein n=1 Tax=Limosilactobacillus mucosae TaxID=97478 RepID=A0AAJ1M857_LIMMU|nr:LTA synthase family protein [Limosilactobacillus mucosae]MDC2827215.1 LTA synthase family protein [Limosilactobacillus mucosae]MDC2834932.1 LTA synthase family protein [Limosilactobacillus mucosae]MDC2842762.1 LTA synthase family protein [Limosilactobacillus mucosae]
MKRLSKLVNTRIGFFALLVFLFWIKTLIAYFTDFKLGAQGLVQYLIVLINPLGTTLLLFGLAFYFKRSRFFYPVLMGIDIANTLLLYLNVIYYREFTDFMTIATMTGYSKVNQGLSGSSLALTNLHDVFYWLDIVVILLLMLFRKIKFDPRAFSHRLAFAFTSVSLVVCGLNLMVAEMDRPQLLGRTFDRVYIVKYLGLDAFTGYDLVKSEHVSQMRKSATKSQLKTVEKFTKEHYAAPNKKLFGIAKGRNVIVIHLESFQQFLIDKKINGQEVTPFLNSLYHGQDTYAFSNFFNQVGQGKTSDAENMLETSTYGLSQGSLFATLGNDNTFQAAPAILKQRAGYTSAVFHGNVASFWNRNNVYKNLGYQYFFDASYFDTSGDKATGYGLKDKLLFADSIKYLQHLQQPFYVKYLTVTNHFPFDLDDEDKDSNFTTTNTGSSTVDNYFVTAHYLDQSLQEFFSYLDKTGLAKKSIIMIYGDHYGISNSENKNLASVLGKNADDWTDFDNVQMQRVPLMFVIPGSGGHGGIYSTYGGEIDVLPTLLHLLGISTKRYIQFGTDLFSSQHDQVVALRNQDFVTPKYTSISGKIYLNSTGKLAKLTKQEKKQLRADQKKVSEELALSDSLNEKNLLRFYHPKDFKTVNPKDYNYANGLKKEKKIEKSKGIQSTSIFSKNNDKTTTDSYSTNAPEQGHSATSSNRIKITNPDGNGN